MTGAQLTSMTRRVLAPLVCVITFGMAIGVWWVATGNPLSYFAATVPPGQTLYVLSKLFGLLGITMLWFQAMCALARFTPALRGFPTLQGRAHIGFGVATVAIVVAHLALFISASTIRTQHAAFDLLLPTFEHGYYRAMVGVGAIAFWILITAAIAGAWRLRGGSIGRWLHRLVFLVMLAGFIHGMTVGSETRFGLMKYVYAFIGLSLSTAVISWAWHKLRRSQRAVAAGTAPVLAGGSSPHSD